MKFGVGISAWCVQTCSNARKSTEYGRKWGAGYPRAWGAGPSGAGGRTGDLGAGGQGLTGHPELVLAREMLLFFPNGVGEWVSNPNAAWGLDGPAADGGLRGGLVEICPLAVGDGGGWLGVGSGT